MVSALNLLVFGCLVSVLEMTIIWIVYRILNNAGIVDVAWSFGFTLLTVLYALVIGNLGTRQCILASMILVWSLRLTWYLGRRFLAMMPKEDPRYTELINNLGENVHGKMFLVFVWQALILTALTAPMAVVFVDSQTEVLPLHYFAILLWFISLIGETLADRQLTDFGRNPNNKGHTCQIGLWRYSRHPNYFFEWLISVSFVVYSLMSPGGWVTIASPLLLLHLLYNVTGIKPSEEHSLKVRDDYAQYQKSTSAFFPWFKS